jgi:type IV secretion system protein VirB6
VGAADPVGTLDAIWESGGTVAGYLWTKGGMGGMGFIVAGAVVWLFIGLLCVYSMFLIALSSIALAVLLALGPFFIAMLLFDATQRFFSAWIAQLANYGLITLLTVMVGALLLQIVKSYAAQTVALGSAILTVDALHMVLVSALVLLLMRQVMPIASGLAGGLALATFGTVGRTLGVPFRGGAELAKRYAIFAASHVMGKPRP